MLSDKTVQTSFICSARRHATFPSHHFRGEKLFTFFSLSIQVYPRSFLWKCWSNKPVPATEKMCATWKAKKEPFPPSSPNLIWVIISESSNQLMWCAYYYLSKTFCWLIKKVQELLCRKTHSLSDWRVYAFLFIFRKVRTRTFFRKEGPIRCRPSSYSSKKWTEEGFHKNLGITMKVWKTPISQSDSDPPPQ